MRLDERLRSGLGLIGSVLLCAGLALGLRLWALSALDLSDFPGPAGAQIVAKLASGQYYGPFRPVLVRLVAWSSRDALEVLHFATVSTGVLGVIGVCLAGWALGGVRNALGSGLVAAIWAMPLLLSVLIGHDGLALGISFCGVGLAWAGSAMGFPGVLLVVAGTATAFYGASLKETALPVLAMLAVVPFLAPRGRWWGPAIASSLAVAGVTAWLLYRGHLPRPTYWTSGMASKAGPSPLADLETLRALGKSRGEVRTMLELMELGLVGALWPGRRWLARLLTVGLGLAVAGYTVAQLGTQLFPRLIVAAWMPFLILCGSALAVPAEGLVSLAKNRAPALRTAVNLAWTLAQLGLVSVLLFDAAAFLNAWSAMRVEQVGTAPSRLPSSPRGWSRRYARLEQDWITRLTFMHVAPAMAYAARATGPVVSLPLNDERQFHLFAPAALKKRAFLELSPSACCQGSADTVCVEGVARALDQAGALLLIPVTGQGPAVVPSHRYFADQLVNAIDKVGKLSMEPPGWASWTGKGHGGALPCQPGSNPGFGPSSGPSFPEPAASSPPSGPTSAGGQAGHTSLPGVRVEPGKGVLLSGRVETNGQTNGARGMVRVDISKHSPLGGDTILTALIVKDNQWQVELLPGIGKISLIAFVDLNADGPSPNEPRSAPLEIDVQDKPIKDIVLRLSKGSSAPTP